MKVSIPELSLVVLIGTSGSGKSTFARRHFKPTEVVSSDVCRGLVSDDENNQAATKDAPMVSRYDATTRGSLMVCQIAFQPIVAVRAGSVSSGTSTMRQR